ncbi:hypothetical protein [Citrifermentans bremense]|nr:hypothetical protein [Citrifermentans bremense]
MSKSFRTKSCPTAFLVCTFTGCLAAFASLFAADFASGCFRQIHGC